MRRLKHIGLMLIFVLALGGCIGGSDSSGTADPVNTGPGYYYDEFSDVAIPSEMREIAQKTFITHNADGSKVGTQEYRGRVELSSLVAAMQSYMLRDGWSLRSSFRSQRSILIFERPDRVCSMYIEDGTFETVMLVFVSSKLNDGALQYSVPGTASTTTPASTASVKQRDGVTVYPGDPLPQ